VKIAPVARADALAAEADALRAIAAAHALRVPAVLGTGTAGAQAFLALEWIDFGSARRGTETQLGEGLARLHQTGAAQFGWHRDNTIGATRSTTTGPRTGSSSSRGSDSVSNSTSPRAPDTAAAGWSRVAASAAGCPTSSAAIGPNPRCSTATCGAATGRRTPRARR